MAEVRLLWIFLFLLPLLIPAANSSEGLKKSQTDHQKTHLQTDLQPTEPQTDPITDLQKSTSVEPEKKKKSVKWHGNGAKESAIVEHVPDFAPGNDVKEREFVAVGFNISAVYIVRAIHTRVTDLNGSMIRAKEQIDYLHEEELENAVENIPALVEQLERTQQMVKTLAPMLQTADGIDEVIKGQLKTANDRVQQLELELSEARESEKNGQEMTKPHHAYWLSKLDNSKLTAAEMAMLKGDLAGVLKGDKDKEKYLQEVNRLIEKFSTKVKEYAVIGESWGKYATALETAEEEDKKSIKKGYLMKLYDSLMKRTSGNTSMLIAKNGQEQKYIDTHDNVVKILLELCVEQVDLLDQIRLEVELHFNDSDKELEAFRENTRKLAEFKLENKEILKRDSKNKKKVNIALDRFNTNEGNIGWLISLNSIGTNLLVNIKDAIEKPYHNRQNHKHVYVKSILEVAEKAAAESKFHYYGRRKGYWTSLFEELMQICYQATQLSQKLSPHLKEMYIEIHEEMPKRLFLGREQEANTHHPSVQREHQLTEAIANMTARIDVLLVKRLLVYARLNRFYMFEEYHEICVQKQYTMENSSHRLLDSFCRKFNKKNRKIGHIWRRWSV